MYTISYNFTDIVGKSLIKCTGEQMVSLKSNITCDEHGYPNNQRTLCEELKIVGHPNEKMGTHCATKWPGFSSQK